MKRILRPRRRLQKRPVNETAKRIKLWLFGGLVAIGMLSLLIFSN